jgi:hypothetical protein
MKRIAAVWCAGVCLLLGCASSLPGYSSHVDEHWGESFQLNMAAMVANPEAPSGSPPEGLDPATSERVAERYYQSQEQQSVQEVRTLLVAE